jgi:hypothetical protein
MSIRLRYVGLLLVCVLASGWAPIPETPPQDPAKLLKDTLAALVAVKDAEGVKSVRPQLDRHAQQLKKVERQLLALVKPKLDKREEQLKKEWERLAPDLQALEKELIRLTTNDKTRKSLADHDLIVALRKRKEMEKRAHIGAHELSDQVEVFKLNNGRYPNKIEELSMKQPDGGAPLVPAKMLRDPWGQLYKLDPTGARNAGLKCDVWSPGHPLFKRMLGNWAEKGADSPKK